MKTVNTLMLKSSLMASIFFAMEIIIFFMVSNHYGIETAGAGALALTGAVVVMIALAITGALAGAGTGALAGTLTLAVTGTLTLAVAGALAGAEEKNKFSFGKTFFFILLMEVFMGVGVFMIIKNIPMGMFAISFACMFPILVSGCDFVLQFNGEKGLFNKKEEVAEMQAS